MNFQEKIEAAALAKGWRDEDLEACFIEGAQCALDLMIEEVYFLFNALDKIAKHDTLDGEKYNNHIQAYEGVVQFAKNAADKWVAIVSKNEKDNRKN